MSRLTFYTAQLTRCFSLPPCKASTRFVSGNMQHHISCIDLSRFLIFKNPTLLIDDRKTHHDLKKIFQTEAAISVCSDEMAFPAQNDLKFCGRSEREGI